MNVRVIILIGLVVFWNNLYSQYTTFIYADSLYTAGCGPNSKEIINRNRVKKIIAFRFDVKDRETKDSSIYGAYYYDTLGRLIKSQMFIKNGTVATTDTFIYNAIGRMVRMTGWSHNKSIYYDFVLSTEVPTSERLIAKDVKILDTVWYSFNLDGRVTKHSYNDGKEVYIDEFHYNEGGRLERMDHFDKNGNKGYSEIYEYTHKGKGIHLAVYIENGEEKYKSVECIYNSKNQCVQSTRYIPHLLISKTSFVYNENGTLHEAVEYGNSRKGEIIYRYYCFQ